jgi:hypothetical protein
MHKDGNVKQMSDAEYITSRTREIAAECQRHFGATVSVRNLLFEDLALSPSMTATVFTTYADEVYALCDSTEPVRLGDVQRLIKKAGFTPAAYAAPGADTAYFHREGYAQFLRAYPGRKTWTSEESSYYQKLVPYAPALVRISGLRGPVRRFNSFSGTWQNIYEPSLALLDKIGIQR